MFKKKTKRFFEIDVLRGIAIIMMVIFHVLFVLNYLAGFSFPLAGGFWMYFGRITAIIFVFLVGVSLTISYARVKDKHWGFIMKKYTKRGLTVFLWGLIVTLVTYLWIGPGFVRFGILHFIGVSIILAIPFLKMGRKYGVITLAIGLFTIVFGLYLRKLVFDFVWLLPFGFMYKGFFTIDYFPIFPWFGVVLMGIFVGNVLYPNAKRRFNLVDLSSSPLIKSLSFFGKYSLLIYLLHVPVLVLFLFLFGII